MEHPKKIVKPLDQIIITSNCAYAKRTFKENLSFTLMKRRSVLFLENDSLKKIDIGIKKVLLKR